VDRNSDQVVGVIQGWLEKQGLYWQAGNARIGGVAAIRLPAETEHYVREQYELHSKLVTALGVRQ
jgi:hypothetical protein